MLELCITDELTSLRLDQVLASHPEVASREEAKRIIRAGLVQTLEGEVLDSPKKKLAVGTGLRFEIPPAEPLNLEAVPGELDIRFEDQDLLVLHKPRGQVVHPSLGHATDSLVNRLMHHCQLSTGAPGRPGIVHRIDKDTSGLLVVAKNNLAHEDLARQFQEHSVERLYQALVWGCPQPPQGTISQPLGRHPAERKKWAVRPQGKRAVTHYRLLENWGELSLVECRLETGRTHQIRVHLTHLGHPLLGDPVYGRARYKKCSYSMEVQAALQAFEGQALHAKTLGFIHPREKKPLFFDSELPKDMQNLLTLLADNASPEESSAGEPERR